MEPDQNIILLKEILDNLSQPEKLNHHPWLGCRFVAEISGTSQPSGARLVEAVTGVFMKIRPAMPPRRGVRLDTRWGEFGLLAALYFAPGRFGILFPSTMREAWESIDQAILLFVFGNDTQISVEDREKYRLVGGELEPAPNSTLSDWHRKGLEHLAGVIAHYEASLLARDRENITRTNRKPANARLFRKIGWIGAGVMLTAIAILLVWAGVSGWRILQRVRSVEQNSQVLLDFTKSFSDPAELEKAGRAISSMRTDLQSLQSEAGWLLDAAPYLGFLPKYGGDISQAPQLLEMGLQLSIAGDEAYKAIEPAIPAMKQNGTISGIMNLPGSLKDGSTRLLSAQAALAGARSIRQGIRADVLSPRFASLLVDKVDPFLLSLQGAFPVDDILSMARLAPRLMGAVGNGPQTYLIMLQNEDEIRPTGGFLTAIGRMVLVDGKLSELSFESSELVDDITKPYPRAPWQLDKYMMSEMLLLRDSNWFADFPTTVEWVRFLYAYSRPQTINGVFTLDQHVIVELLRQVGPVQVDGVAEMITVENVQAYMRLAKEQKPPQGVSAAGWDRKQFISRLADPLVKKLINGDSHSWQKVAGTLIQLLDEKHILIHMDDPEMKSLLAQRGWDGTIIPPANSDFLLVVDTNIGFNKTNAVVTQSLTYQLDLTDLQKPSTSLTVRHSNNASGLGECIQFNRQSAEFQAEKDYPLNDCYWSYLRIYTPAGTQMIGGTPHVIPAGLSLYEQEIPARIDALAENIPGIQSYGTLLVVPRGQSLETSFNYALPASVVIRESTTGSLNYTLKVQKQPGTLAVPLTLKVKLPTGMTILNPMSGLMENMEGWVYSTNLQRDGTFEIEFVQAGTN